MSRYSQVPFIISISCISFILFILTSERALKWMLKVMHNAQTQTWR